MDVSAQCAGQWPAGNGWITYFPAANLCWKPWLPEWPVGVNTTINIYDSNTSRQSVLPEKSNRMWCRYFSDRVWLCSVNHLSSGLLLMWNIVSHDRCDWSVQERSRGDTSHNKGQQRSVEEDAGSDGHVWEGGECHTVGRGGEYKQ